MADREPRVALVTGSATGIGRDAAVQLAERGLDVAINFTKSAAEAEQTAEEVRKRGRRAILCQASVADDQAVRGMVERCVRELGGLDVLVNNAGMTHFIKHTDLEAATEAVWDEILAVNLKGAFFCCRAAIPAMEARGGGSIVNVASVAGIRGAGSSIPYAASKGAMITMTKSLAAAFAPRIRVNAVAPGPVETRWLEPHPEMVRAAIAVTPLKRASLPRDIADAIAFLALDAQMMTGQCLVIDGGRTM